MQTKIASRINTTFTLVANTLRFSLNLKALVQEQATIPQAIIDQLIKTYQTYQSRDEHDERSSARTLIVEEHEEHGSKV